VSVTSPAGFVAAGVAAGIKPSGDPDLALVATADGAPVPAAATFTQNRLAAAPVQVSRTHLERTGGRAAAVVLNSGNANAATGAVGVAAAKRMAAVTAAAIGCEVEDVLVCSTGLIGIPLPIDIVAAGIPTAAAARSPEGGPAAARAMMTTDTVAKEVLVHRPGFVVGGMAKGAAMLAPNMATMLAVVTTDAACEPGTLQRVLTAGVASSFNVMVSDGCTSTNDTVILLASGLAGPVDEADLAAAVAEACFSLAAQMVGDAEGATKVVRVEVTGAASDAEALAGARAIATSALCKCSWYGEDPYWGRIASELGNAGIAFDADRFSVAYGPTTVAAGGIAVDHDAAAVKHHLSHRHIDVRADLGLGSGAAAVLTNDLAPGYIDENMRTS
jgi:glutamate N-acetyltransferase / amino-acid N-acetyltransferase